MKQKTTLILTTLTFLFLSTLETNAQSIELPDFVITGVQSVSIPTMKKNKSDYIPVVSEEFLTPQYDVEEFVLTEYSNPIKMDLEFYDKPHGYNGLLKLGVGSQTLPTGDFYFHESIGQFLFNTHIWGSNIREYIPYAGYNTSGGTVNFNYFINKRSLWFHGLAIDIDATFLREGYNLYGSISPSTERENHFSRFNLSFINRLQRTLNYGLKVSGKNVKLTKDNLKEARYDWDLFLKYDFGFLAAGIDGRITTQEVTEIDDEINRYTYFSTNGFVEFVSSKVFYFKVGAHLSSQGSNTLFSPFAYFTFDIQKQLSLFASYSGESEFLSINDFISQNRYFKIGQIMNVFQRKASNLKGAIKYEYAKSLEIKAGITFEKYNNYLYFEDNAVDAFFDINTIDDVKRNAIFFSIDLDANQYGKLFANLEFQNVTNGDSKKITYTPSFITDISYSYRFLYNLLGRVQFSYYGSSYADIENTVKLPNFINLSFYLRYNLLENLALTATLDNLLNRKNYLFKNYREKPFDMVFGVEYNW